MLSRHELERLYDAHATGLYAYLRTFVKGEADAKDLLQDLFIKLATKGLPVNLENERAYLWHLAHNLAIDWLRRTHTRNRVFTSTVEEPPALFAEVPDPDAAAFTSSVQHALDELPTEQRSIAQMKLWDGLTFDEIAQVQGIPLNTAASRYRYAIDKLRARLRPLYEEITA